MSFISAISGLASIIAKPIELLMDYGREPLRSWEHDRTETSRSANHQRDLERSAEQLKMETDARIKLKEAETKAEITKNTAVMKMTREFDILDKEKDAELYIKKKTEIDKISRELDEWQKDNAVERMERVSEAVIRYKERLTQLNVAAMNAIGHMQLELRERAHELVYERASKYKALQDLAFADATSEAERIEEKFSGNDLVRNMLIKAVEIKLVNMIDASNNFINGLNNDLAMLNQSAIMLAEKGQGFIDSHLNQFHMKELSAQEPKLIRGEVSETNSQPLKEPKRS